MNGLENPFRKKYDPKNRKNSKNQSEITAGEQKTTSKKTNFCSNTVFSLYFTITLKKFHATKPLAFSSISCFGVTEITNPIWLKIMKMCKQILNKNIAGSILETTRRRKFPILMTKQLE